MVFKKVFLPLHGFRQRDMVCDLLLPSAPNDQVAFIQVNNVIINDGHHRFLHASVHQVGLC